MVLKRLSGRHVPRFVAAGDLRARPYLVMELVEGEPLHGRERARERALLGILHRAGREVGEHH